MTAESTERHLKEDFPKSTTRIRPAESAGRAQLLPTTSCAGGKYFYLIVSEMESFAIGAVSPL